MDAVAGAEGAGQKVLLADPLKQVLADHKEWIQSDKKRGKCAVLTGANLKGENLVQANLVSAVLVGADLTGADLRGAALSGANLRAAKLFNADLDSAILTDSDLSGAVLVTANLERANLFQANLGKVNCFDANLKGANLEKANLREADLAGANLSDANLNGANLQKARLRWSDLRSSRFRCANLEEADLSDVKVNDSTDFSFASLDRCRIQRYTIEMLPALTQPQKMVTHIDDPVAEMRAHFSGFWRLIHIIALLVFVLPYMTFLLKLSLKARFLDADSHHSQTMLSALFDFIYTGGRFDGRIAWVPLVIFCFCLMYNILRTVLLFKTMHLEHREAIRRLPERFSLQGGWGRALKVLTFMFFINIGLVFWHSIHFLLMRVDNSDIVRTWAGIFGQ